MLKKMTPEEKAALLRMMAGEENVASNVVLFEDFPPACPEDREEGGRRMDYCTSIEKKSPVITSGTFYSHYEPDGSKWAGVPQCHSCRRSNSYGKHGCPRLNAELPIRVGKQEGEVDEVENW